MEPKELKVGKVPESVLKRSVLTQIHTKRPEVILGAGVGEDCAAVRLGEDEVFVISTDPVTGTATDIGNLAIHITMNDLASAGAEPVGAMLTVLLPEHACEGDLKEIMGQMEVVCAKAKVQIMGGHTEVTRAVNQPLVNVCGVGKAKAGKLVSTAGASPGDDILVSKWIGLEGTSIIAKEKGQELAARYPMQLIKAAQGFDQYLSVLPEAAIAVASGVKAMHDVTEGGIFGALWELAESSGIDFIEKFAANIRTEFKAVWQAKHSNLSNGILEGTVNKIKTIKRQMYGRAKLKLLMIKTIYAHTG